MVSPHVTCTPFLLTPLEIQSSSTRFGFLGGAAHRTGPSTQSGSGRRMRECALSSRSLGGTSRMTRRPLLPLASCGRCAILRLPRVSLFVNPTCHICTLCISCYAPPELALTRLRQLADGLRGQRIAEKCFRPSKPGPRVGWR